jgi:prolyl oligopeptidase
MLCFTVAGASVRAQTVSPAPSPSPAATAASSANPVAPAAASAMPAVAPTELPDPYLWLESQTGARAMAWVRAENAKTLAVLERDPRFAILYPEILKISQSPDRIAYPAYSRGRIFNFWQDSTHVRGIWRSTTAAGYARAKPDWHTVLDLDALAKNEHANWVWEGANCEEPAEQRCLLSLSDGGEDATTDREFDAAAGAFVKGGFALPRGKQDAVWENSGTLLVSRAWSPGELTTSGYPYDIRRLHRGTAFSSAVEVFRGKTTDIGVFPEVLDDGRGEHVTLIDRGLTFFTSEYYVLTKRGALRLDIPPKVSPTALVDGRMLFTLSEDWTAAGTTFKSGSLVSADLPAVVADPAHVVPTLVYAPGPRDSLGAVAVTRDHVLLTTYHNVRGRAYVYSPMPHHRWSVRRLSLPDDSSISVVDANLHGDEAFVSVTGFLTPSTLWLENARTGSLTVAKSLPPQFDASKDVVEQHEATSTDGTKIPYFLVRPKSMAFDGSTPTILEAYGGFAVSSTPSYLGSYGKAWIERGGAYVLANIRGGGEFGPAWHEAGLKTHRQRIYDDFASVGRDLIARNITSPRRLGIVGGSNGGLLMGVEFTQHPELWNAVDIQVPLLDMLRFEKIDAGASWVGEYGSVSVPSERAFLASISPYNNIHAGVHYPEPFIWTTTKDDRVGPQHARKFAARLAEMGIPYLFYEVTEGGHGSGANAKERSKTTALEFTYFIRKLMDSTASALIPQTQAQK